MMEYKVYYKRYENLICGVPHGIIFEPLPIYDPYGSLCESGGLNFRILMDEKILKYFKSSSSINYYKKYGYEKGDSWKDLSKRGV